MTTAFYVVQIKDNKSVTLYINYLLNLDEKANCSEKLFVLSQLPSNSIIFSSYNRICRLLFQIITIYILQVITSLRRTVIRDKSDLNSSVEKNPKIRAKVGRRNSQVTLN